MAARYTIGIDLGGTNLKGGVCDSAGVLCGRHSVPTQAERGVEHVLERMAELVGALTALAGLQSTDIAGVGVGAPGPISHQEGVIFQAPNLPGWVNIPLREWLSARTGLRVTLENDANAAAFGEFTAGAGRDVRDMVMLTLGTGIGGGVILDGRLVRGVFDSAGEIGHMLVVPDGRACPCGQRGCLERYASALAIAERVGEAIQAGAASQLEAAVRSQTPFDARDVLAAAGSGDALAARIWDEACLYLAMTVVDLQHLLNPELVVFAGGLINAGDELLAPVLAHYERMSWKIAPDAPRIALATLGADAGTIGAAMLARA